MNHPLVDLVGELERLWADPAMTDLVELAKLIEQRQQILTRIQSTDTRELDPAVRESVAARVRAVRDRDQLLVEIIRKKCDKVLKALEDVARARTAARGYRPGEPNEPTVLNRLA